MFQTSLSNAQVPPMPLLPNIAPLVLDLVLSRLAPWFLTTTADPEAAREAAASLLVSYDVQTEAEAHLAAEAISLSFGVLEALSRSVDPDLPLNAVLRLRGSANTMNRSAHKSQSALQALQKQRRTAPEAPPVHQVQTPQAPPPAQASSGIVLSRQQRRALERSQEKARRQQAEQARRDALRAARAEAASKQAALPPTLNQHQQPAVP